MQQWYMRITGYSMKHGNPSILGVIHKSDYWVFGPYVNKAFQQVNFMARDVFAAMHNRFDIYIEAGFTERNRWLSKTCTEFEVRVESHLNIPVRAVPIPFQRLLVRKTYAQEESQDVC